MSSRREPMPAYDASLFDPPAPLARITLRIPNNGTCGIKWVDGRLDYSDMSTSTELLTAEDLLRMVPDGYRYELVKGELLRMPPAGNIHGKRTMRLGWRLAQHVEANDLGIVFAAETGFRLASDPDTVRAPDVALVIKARVGEVGEFEGFWPGAPDLAVEVIS